MALLSLGLGLGLTERARGPVLAWAKPGDGFAQLGGITSFSRADATACATHRTAVGGMNTVAANVLRDAHYIGAVRTVLLEATDSNPFTKSQKLDDLAWTKQRTTVSADAIAAPDGTLTGDKLVETAAGTTTYYTRRATPALTNSTPSIYSAFIQKAQRTFVAMHTFGKDAVDRYSGVNLTTGALGDTDPQHTVQVESWGAWWRLMCKFNSNAGAGSPAVDFLIAQSAVNPFTVTGDITKGLYWWGEQFSADQAVFRSYIATDAGAVTRAPDALVLNGIVTPVASTLYYRYFDLATWAFADAAAAYVSGAAITPPVDRAYTDFAILQGTLTAAQARVILGY